MLGSNPVFDIAGRTSKKHITPYMHIMLKHIPSQMRQLSGIKRFSGQRKHIEFFHVYSIMFVHKHPIALEKNNDDARWNYRSSNQ